MCQDLGHLHLIQSPTVGVALAGHLVTPEWCCHWSAVVALAHCFFGGAWVKDGIECIWRPEFLRAGCSVESQSGHELTSLHIQIFIPPWLRSLYLGAGFQAASHIRMWFSSVQSLCHV